MSVSSNKYWRELIRGSGKGSSDARDNEREYFPGYEYANIEQEYETSRSPSSKD